MSRKKEHGEIGLAEGVHGEREADEITGHEVFDENGDPIDADLKEEPLDITEDELLDMLEDLGFERTLEPFDKTHEGKQELYRLAYWITSYSATKK